MFHSLYDVKEKIETLYETGITRGVYLGFQGLHEYFSMKPVGTTYVYGSPFHGKTEWVFEILLNLTEFYGFKHAIYSPETGSPEEIYAELISKYLRKPFYKNNGAQMSAAERLRAEDHINHYFYVIDPKSKDITIEDFYESVKELERQKDIKINTTVCDPFNELKHDFSGDSGRQDLYIENRLGYIRKDAMSYQRHNIVITHCRDQQHVQTKEGKRYYPAATPREIAGGQAWYRKAMNLICIWRPPNGLMDEVTGIPYEDNEVHVIINKYKPKGVGKRGTCKLYFDQHTNRYYEKINGGQRYAAKESTNPTTYEF